jgi:hypothetical protein
VDVTNVNIIEEALQYRELQDKIKEVRARGTTEEVLRGESLDGTMEIIKEVDDSKKRKSQNKRRLSKDETESDEEQDKKEDEDTAVQMQLKELAKRFNIKVDRHKARE